MPDSKVDVAILGAGPVGCALALALADSGLSIALVGRNSGQAPQGPEVRPAFRPLALSYASRLILERIGAWNGCATTAIEQIHVCQAGGFGRTRISREDLELPALGYVVDYGQFASHLARLVDPAVRTPDVGESPSARLVVHAEGLTGAEATGKDYGHTAIVAVVESERPAHGIAWERFTSEGPLALLPHNGNYGLVWSRTDAAASALMSMSERQLLAELQSAFGLRAGRFRAVGARAATALVLRYRTTQAAAGEVHIGNAAQTLHPVAGQGLNLGLRDAWELAALVHDASRDALEAATLAEQFARTRRLDAQATIRATDLLATLYMRRDPLSAALRGAALTALDVFPPARRVFARRMIYGASAW